MTARSLLWLGAALGLLLAGCQDDSPEGPGSWNARVRSSGVPPGGVTVELRGVRIESVEGIGETSAFGAPLTGQGPGPIPWRVVVVSPTPGELHFLVRVYDLAEGRPRPAVVGAVGGDDQPVSISTFSVDFSVAR